MVHLRRWFGDKREHLLEGIHCSRMAMADVCRLNLTRGNAASEASEEMHTSVPCSHRSPKRNACQAPSATRQDEHSAAAAAGLVAPKKRRQAEFDPCWKSQSVKNNGTKQPLYYHLESHTAVELSTQIRMSHYLPLIATRGSKTGFTICPFVQKSLILTPDYSSTHWVSLWEMFWFAFGKFSLKMVHTIRRLKRKV